MALHVLHCRKVRHDALRDFDFVAYRASLSSARTCCSDEWISTGWHCQTCGKGRSEPDSLRFNDALGTSVACPAEDETVLAAQLGLDVATYRLLRALEQRDILPEDYDLLGRLDESVKPKTLSTDDLTRFATRMYCVAPVMAIGNATCPEFGTSYWRLPLPVLKDGSEEVDSSTHCFGLDFWKVPVANLDDHDNASTVASQSEADDDQGSFLGSTEVCGVCLVDFDDGDELRVLPCGHYFHQECIDHWLLHSATVCPVDKRDLLQSD